MREVTYENYIKARLVDFVAAEAYTSGGIETMLAVAQVLANRVAEGWQGGDWLKVISNAGQHRGTIQPEYQIDPRDGNFRELLRRIDEVYHGIADDSGVNIQTQDGKAVSLYYAELHNINRDWFTEHITDEPASHPRLATVGQLTFFG
jgi:hypothetical protein